MVSKVINTKINNRAMLLVKIIVANRAIPNHLLDSV